MTLQRPGFPPQKCPVIFCNPTHFQTFFSTIKRLNLTPAFSTKMNRGLVSSVWVQRPFLWDPFEIWERRREALILTQIIHDGLYTNLPASRCKLLNPKMKLLPASVRRKTSRLPLSAKRGGVRGGEDEEEGVPFFPYTTLFLCNVSEGVVK